MTIAVSKTAAGRAAAQDESPSPKKGGSAASTSTIPSDPKNAAGPSEASAPVPVFDPISWFDLSAVMASSPSSLLSGVQGRVKAMSLSLPTSASLSLPTFWYRKLVTPEDHVLIVRHVHKTFGILVLAHFIARFALCYTTGSMHFVRGHWSTTAFYLFHLLLSCSSFIFKIPEHRVIKTPVIWRELQLHNIVFTFRSVSVAILVNYGFSHVYRCVAVVASHLLADLVSHLFKRETTIRGLPQAQIPRSVKKMYAFFQFMGTSALLRRDDLAVPFAIMLPVQTSAFFMTLSRKGLISNMTWHKLYTLTLFLNVSVLYAASPDARFSTAHNPIDDTHQMWPLIGLVLFAVGRMRFGLSKYLLWTVFLAAMHVLNAVESPEAPLLS